MTIPLPPKHSFPPPRAMDTLVPPCSNVLPAPTESPFLPPSSGRAQAAAGPAGTVPVPHASLGALCGQSLAGSLCRLPGEMSTLPPQVKHNKAVRRYSLSLSAVGHRLGGKGKNRFTRDTDSLFQDPFRVTKLTCKNTSRNKESRNRPAGIHLDDCWPTGPRTSRTVQGSS